MKYTFLFAASLFARTAIAQTCEGAWSPSVDLMRDGRPVYVQRGVVTSLGARTLLLGSPTIFWITPTALIPHEWQPGQPIDTAAARWSMTRAGAVFDSKVVTDGVPPVDSLSIRTFPHLVGWSPGRVDVAWTVADPLPREQSVDSTGHRREPKPNRIERVTFDGVQWSTPEVIVRGQMEEPVGPPAVRAGVAFDQSVFAITDTEATKTVIRVGVRQSDRWTTATLRDTTRLFIQGPVAFKSLEGDVVVLYRAYESSGFRIFATRIARWINDSAVWTPVIEVANIGNDGGFLTPTSAHLGADTVIVGWHQRSSGALSAVSADGGKSWRVLPLAPGVSAEGLRFVVDSRGLLHALYRSPSNPSVLNSPGGIMVSTFRNGRWTTPSVAAAISDVSPAAGTTADRGVVVLGASMIVRATGAEPKSWIRTWMPSCR